VKCSGSRPRRACTPRTFEASLVAAALEHIGDAVREKYFEPLVAGQVTSAFANTERDVGTDVLAMSTHATQDGSDWIINGRKAWITNSHFADFIQVVAVTEPGAGTRSLSMFIVDADSPGFRRGRDIPTMLNDGLTGELEFTDVRVPMENVVGEVGDGFALAMSWINWRRLCRGGMCSGWGQWLLDRAVRHVPPIPDITADLDNRLAVAEELIDEGARFVHVHTKTTDEAGHSKQPRAKLDVLNAVDPGLARLTRLAGRGPRHRRRHR